MLVHLRHAALALVFLVALGLSSAYAQTGPLDQAVTALQISNPLPPGWQVKIGTDTDTKGAGALTDVETKTIYINPPAIVRTYPPVTQDQSTLPGVLYIFLLHEWFHVIEHEEGEGSAEAGGGGSSPYNTDPDYCGDIQLTPGIAVMHCQLICDVALHGNGKTAALCALYKSIRENYNDGKRYPGGASAVHGDLNCPGTYPGDIPACICPIEGGQNLNPCPQGL